MKARRQALLLELVDREPLRSQEQLRRRLHQRGFQATQATISRDIKELGLFKRAGDGAYQRLPPRPPTPASATACRRLAADESPPESALAALERAAVTFMRGVERVQHLVVIRTGAGQ